MSEQFRVPKVNVIESSEGFAVEVLGRTGLRYTEIGRDLFVDSEVLAADFGLLVIANSIQNWGHRLAVLALWNGPTECGSSRIFSARLLRRVKTSKYNLRTGVSPKAPPNERCSRRARQSR
jgi:hypothetical protein